MLDWDLSRDGFVVIERLLGADDLAALRADVDQVVARPLPPGCDRPHNTLAPLTWADPAISRTLRAHGRRARIAEALSADDLRWISGYVSVKEPRSEALALHQDWWCWDHPVSFRREAPQVALLVYLGDTSARTAALRAVPGTHHGVSSSDPVTLAVSAGDAVACDYRVLHGTHRNDGGARRDCLILNFAPSWSSLPDEIRAHLTRHPALPPVRDDALLPTYDGRPRDLPLNRVGPLA